MNIIFLILLVSTIISTVLATNVSSGNPLVLPLAKDPDTQQYYTTSIQIGTPSVPVNLVVDLGNRYSWLACDDIGYNFSTTYTVVKCDSPECRSYSYDNLTSFCFTCDDTINPSCLRTACWADVYSPFTEDVEYPSGLIKDKLSTTTTSHNTILSNFTFGCANTEPLIGLSTRSKGILTLARSTPIALQLQLSSALNLPRKFALCLPSSGATGGGIHFGGGGHYYPPSKMVKTRLVVNPHTTDKPYLSRDPSLEYFIGVRSIQIGGEAVRGYNRSLFVIDERGDGGVALSTMEPFTKLHSEIYRAVVELFMAKLAKSSMTIIKRVPSVAPFGACFSWSSASDESLPAIDFVLDGRKKRTSSKWRINGSNYIAKVSENVSCLAFVDAGMKMEWPKTSVVIGGRQMEDSIIEFDLESGMLGITSSLKRFGSSCSHFIEKGIE